MTETQEQVATTRDEYVRRLEAAMRVCNDIRRNYGWCEQWRPTLLRLTGDFRPQAGSNEHAEVHVEDAISYGRDLFNDDGWEKYQAKLSTRYDEELTRIRGRLLQLARQDTITLADANRVIRALDLATFGPDQPQAYSVERMFHTMYAEVPGSQEEVTAAIEAAYRLFLDSVHAILDYRTGMERPALRIRPADLHGARTQIPASECVPLR